MLLIECQYLAVVKVFINDYLIGVADGQLIYFLLYYANMCGHYSSPYVEKKSFVLF